jgi:hypothetical protein
VESRTHFKKRGKTERPNKQEQKHPFIMTTLSVFLQAVSAAGYGAPPLGLYILIKRIPRILRPIQQKISLFCV